MPQGIGPVVFSRLGEGVDGVEGNGRFEAKRRRRRTAIAAGLVCLAGLGGGEPAGAQAAEGERSIELVSASDTSGNPIDAAQLGSAADTVLYRVDGGMPGSPSGIASFAVARRGPSGWSSASILPPRTELPYGFAEPVAATGDLSRLVLGAGPSFGARAQALARVDANGALEAPPYVFPTGTSAPAVAASHDLTVLAGARPGAPLVPADPSADGGLYDFGSGQPQLTGLLPDGLAPTCGAVFAGTGDAASATSAQHWVAAGGERVVFQSRGSGDCDADPLGLFLRNRALGTTAWLSQPLPGEPDRGSTFVQATSDGTEIFHVTASRLAFEDANDLPDVYRYTDGSGNDCLTCVVPAANVALLGDGTPSVAVSQDGSRVYFTSPDDLLPGQPVTTVDSLYRYDAATDALTYVAPANAVTADPQRGGALTPDGSVLVFATDVRVTAYDNEGFLQFYRHDALSGTTTCISCPSGRPTVAPGPGDGSPSLVAATPIAFDRSSPLSADGRVFAFRSAQQLVPGDQNGADDVYEWHDGSVRLVTDGAATPGAPHQVVGVSADGRDLLFISHGRLAPEATDGTAQLYDARVDGGFADRGSPACEGERCRPAAGALADPPTPGTSVVVGAANARPGEASPRGRLAARWVRGERLALAVHVPDSGRLEIAGPRVMTARRAVHRPGRVVVRLRLTREARQALVGKGRFPVVVRVAYWTSSGRAGHVRIARTRVVRATPGHGRVGRKSLTEAAAARAGAEPAPR